MSKPVFAYAVFQLHERGALDVDAPLARYDTAPFIPGEPRLGRITARHILSHTSGLPAWRAGDRPLSLLFSPGERWEYSGEGYFWLQSVVSRLAGLSTDSSTCGTYEADLRVCGTDIDAYLRRRVLEPLGMASGSYLWNDEIAARAARPHDRDGGPLTKKRARTPDVARYAAAGGLQCTVGDYAAFICSVIAPPAADDAHLRPSTIDEMVRPVVHVSEQPFRSSWASGWQVLHTDAGDLIAHGGDNTGFHAFAAASRDRRSGFVVMTNGDGGVPVIGRLLDQAFLPRLIEDPV
jgi:CubicO group peptidase (beta-lactamase class C family)